MFKNRSYLGFAEKWECGSGNPWVWSVNPNAHQTMPVRSYPVTSQLGENTWLGMYCMTFIFVPVKKVYFLVSINILS
jgi:hypothetical protein